MTATRPGIHNFRPDIEGLRAIAIIMVLAYHVFTRWAPGGFAGVDVFFVISGFLITLQLIKEIDRDGRIALFSFYARRAKRLLPAAALALLGTVVLVALFLPTTRWSSSGGDIFSAALYFVNWHFAARSVNYLAEGLAPSPVLHFWSLSVEEQYYLVWPVLLTLAMFALRRWLHRRTILWVSLAILAIPSFAFSVYYTQVNPGPAYYITTTRMWELAVGGVVAMLSARCQRIPAKSASIIGWTGVAMILACLLFVTPQTPWPGIAAALPTFGTALAIIGGFSAGPNGPVRILGSRMFVWLGAISYSLYLWHWPLLSAAESKFEATQLPLTIGLPVVACSVLLAWLSYKFVENPIRFSTRMKSNTRYALSAGVNFSLAGAIGGLLLGATPAGQTAGARVGTYVATPGAPGARVLGATPAGNPKGKPEDNVGWFTPSAAQADHDNPVVYADDCQAHTTQSKIKPCIYGNPNGDITVAVAGDSKMTQWMPALQPIAVNHHWKLVLNTKGACPFTARQNLTYRHKPYKSCLQWNHSLFKYLKKLKPDYLIVSLGRGGHKHADQSVVDGILAWWKPLAKQGTKIIAIANNPSPGMNVADCVAQHPHHLTRCSFQRTHGNGTPSMAKAVSKIPSANFINLNDAICPDKMCPAVIGHVMIYRQGSHLTRTYVETMTPRLEKALTAAGLP